MRTALGALLSHTTLARAAVESGAIRTVAGAVARIAALAALAMAPPPAPLAAQQCEPIAPRVSAERHGERVDLFVEVPGHASVVVRLDADLTFMQPDRRLPYVATYRAGRRIRALRLRPDPGQRWTYQYSYRWAWGDHRAVHDDAYRYRLPYDLPYDDAEAFPLIQGPDGDYSHAGKQAYDWSMPEGTGILAARDGVVVETCDIHEAGGPIRALLDRANYVHIQHADGTIARYIHLMPAGVRVKPGDRVERGQLIGLSGNTGFSAGPHLHFEVVRRDADLQLATLPVRFDRDP